VNLGAVGKNEENRQSRIKRGVNGNWKEGENWEVSTPLYFARYWVSDREEYGSKS
jgi:hypothetical protein